MKAKHGSTRPNEGYKRVLWGDLMTMFEPDVESPVWRTLQNEKSVDLEAIGFLRSKLSEATIYAYLYGGREKISSYTCNNHMNAQQEASS
ncbi:hypothetical protein Tco_0903490 [Tanacetum coccineum]